MNTVLACLLIAVLTPYVLAGIGGYHKGKQLGKVDNNNPRAQAAQLTGAGARAVAAQQNAWEALAVFTASLAAAFFAGVGRGYIAPLAWTVAMIVASQVLTVLGWGAWFPWSVPAILAGAGGTQVEPVTVEAVGVVALVVLTGLAATITWWERADQTG